MRHACYSEHIRGRDGGDAMGGGAYRGVRKAGVEGQWELARVERGVKKARTGVLRRGCVVVGVVFVLVPPPWV